MILVQSLYRLSTFTGKWFPRRCIQTCLQPNQELILEPLIEREVIQVKGDEVMPFLQGLITNDIKHLHPSANKAIYAMFLNKAGRIMYDTILYSTSEPTRILIDCDKNVSSELQRHLRLYRVRRKIDIDSLHQETKVWQAFKLNNLEENIAEPSNKEDAHCLAVSADPRLKQLGIRLLASNENTFSDISKLFEQQTVAAASSDGNFRLHRYSLGIAEGVKDIPPGKCFPLEANCDILNGVSFHKGCYIGQELTARVHHTGMIRKRHMPVKLTAPLSEDATATVQNEVGANCGTIYGSIADRALGLLRVENVFKAKKLFTNGSTCFTERPQWWPHELHSNVLKAGQKNV